MDELVTKDDKDDTALDGLTTFSSLILASESWWLRAMMTEAIFTELSNHKAK